MAQRRRKLMTFDFFFTEQQDIKRGQCLALMAHKADWDWILVREIPHQYHRKEHKRGTWLVYVSCIPRRQQRKCENKCTETDSSCVRLVYYTILIYRGEVWSVTTSGQPYSSKGSGVKLSQFFLFCSISDSLHTFFQSFFSSVIIFLRVSAILTPSSVFSVPNLVIFWLCFVMKDRGKGDVQEQHKWLLESSLALAWVIIHMV